MQLFYSNHWIRNCNKGEPIGQTNSIWNQKQSCKIGIHFSIFKPFECCMVFWVEALDCWLYAGKNNWNNFISQKHFSVFFYNANQLNNEIERNRKELICHWKIKFDGEHCHSEKCNAGVGFSKCWFAVVTSVAVVVAAREMVSHGWTSVGFWGDAMWEGVGVGNVIDGIRGCRRCWSFAAVVGRSPPVVVRLWVSNRDNHGVWVVAVCGR